MRRLVSCPCRTSPPGSFPADLSAVGDSDNQPVCDGRLSSDSSVLCVGKRSSRGSVRRSSSKVGLSRRLRVSSSSSSSSRASEDESFSGRVHPHHSVLANTKVVPASVGNEHSGSETTSPPSGHCAGSDHRIPTTKAQSPPSSRLEDFRQIHANSLSDDAFCLGAGSWRKSSSSRYDAAWCSFKDFLRSRRLSIHSVNVNVVADYLSFLFDKKLAYRTICLHRSVLSMTLPHLDNFSIGEHPVISRLIKGIFHRRPPSRRIFQTWDVGKVFDVFLEWSTPLSFKQLQRKLAFLIAMATAKRPSELASLRCSAAFMTASTSSIHFIPSFLSKTDRQTHLGLPITLTWLGGSDSSLCPVETLETLLQMRHELSFGHDYIFCQFRHPYKKVSTSSFSKRLSWALRYAGITAPPGSTRAVSVSNAFARGMDMATILDAGDWSSAQTFYRHYLRPSFASSN